jgi:hypothetical protein
MVWDTLNNRCGDSFAELLKGFGKHFGIVNGIVRSTPQTWAVFRRYPGAVG